MDRCGKLHLAFAEISCILFIEEEGSGGQKNLVKFISGFCFSPECSKNLANGSEYRLAS
jgi:hypothetical protein